MQPGAWSFVSVSRQWDSELCQDLGMTWDIGYDTEVTVVEVWTVLEFFLIFGTVNYFISI